jgi:hypothetical protein
MVSEAMAAAGDFAVTPRAGMWLWVALMMVIAMGGVVTAMKGRSGWLLVGLVVSGLIWPAAAVLLPAEPGSYWARRMRRTPRSR